MDDRVQTRDLEDIDNPEIMHEKRDINARIVLGFGAALVLAAIVIHLLVWLLFGIFGSLETGGDYPREYPMVAAGQIRLPPAPRLQAKPREDLKELRHHEDQLLNGYTWINKATGAVRVPIADAMKQVIDQGFPIEQQPAEPPELPTVSSSGRVVDPSVRR